MTSSNEAIGKILKVFRITNDLSTRDLAAKMQVTHSYISLLENGKRKVSHDILHAFAKTYNIGEYQIMDIVHYYEELEGDELQRYQLCLLKVLELTTSKHKKAESKVDKNVLVILKIARQANQMTVQYASSISGVSVVYITELENGKKDNISMTYLKKLSNAYNLNADQVIKLAEYYEQLEVNEERKARLTLIKTLEIIDNNLNP